MRRLIKNRIRDTKIEPHVRWLIKRFRQIKMPLDLVKNEIYDRQAFDVIRRVLSASSNCIDIGCHQGQFLNAFQEFAPLGLHYAFEPIPHMEEHLRTMFPAARIFPYALGSTKGETIFYVIPQSPALSGLNPRQFLSPDKERAVINVHMERLDDIIPRDYKVHFIKIDVEGAEGPVIMGGLELIKRNKPYIIIEHGAQSSEAFGFPSSQIYDLLVNDCGLGISLLRDWLHGKSPLTREEFLRSREWYFLAHRHY